MQKKTLSWIIIFLTIITFLIVSANFSITDSYKSSNQKQWNKNEIMNVITTNSVFKIISWSPDNSMVIFISEDDKKLMAWNIGESKAKIVMDNYGFNKLIWSPDSSYFLATTLLDNAGSLVESRIIKADDLSKKKFGVVSGHFPVWSFNSKYLATDSIETDKSTKWSAITIISLETGETRTLVRSKDYSTIYQVKCWDNQNVISYLEKDNETNQITEKSIYFNTDF